MRTDELIQRLAGNLTPVQRIRSPWRLTLAGIFGSFAAGLLGLFIIHLRGDFRQAAVEAPFLISSAGLILTAVALVATLVLLSFPGRAGQRPSLFTAAGALAAGGVGMIAWTAASGAGPEDGGLRCAVAGTVLGVVPLAILLRIVGGAAPTRPILNAALAGICAATVGAFSLGFCCANGHPGHLTEWHILLPMIALGSVGAGLGRHLLRW